MVPIQGNNGLKDQCNDNLFQKTMFDVRIFHPYAKTYKDQKISDAYSRHVKEKQRSYLHRVLQIEKASFTPLVYSTNGGMAKESRRFHKKVAHVIPEKAIAMS